MNSLNLLYGAAAFGVFSFVPLFAEVAYGMGPLQAGLLLTARAVGMIVIAVVASLTIRRTGYRLPMAAGFAVVASGLLMMAAAPLLANAFGWLAVASLLCGVGVGLSGPASNNAALELMPDQIAVITGLRGMFRQVGGIVSISLIALAIGHGANEGAGLRRAFVVVAILALAGIPAIAGVPNSQLSTSRTAAGGRDAAPRRG